MPSTITTPITFDDIQAAAARISGIAKRTPVITSRSLDEQAGLQAFLKCENFQTGGAFKIRGAANLLYAIPQAERGRGVIAYSSGNHAQAVAIAAQSLGIQATLVMPQDAPLSKVEGARARNPRIVFYDRFTQDRVAVTKRISEETGAITVPPFDHPMVMAGAGTLAVELLDDVANLDAIVVPIGGGGMISGCAIAAKHLNPKIRVIGVEPADGNDTYLSLAAGKRVEIPPPATMADGLRAQMPGALTFPIIQRLVDEIVLVTEEEIRAAVKFLLMRVKIVVEPSGAVPVAAALCGKIRGVNRAGLVLSGGNLDYEMLGRM